MWKMSDSTHCQMRMSAVVEPARATIPRTKPASPVPLCEQHDSGAVGVRIDPRSVAGATGRRRELR
jgi:hypothetical protein